MLKWDYYATTAAKAAQLSPTTNHRVWSAQWVLGLPKEGDAFVIVATDGAAPSGTFLTSVELPAEKDPFPPPPPPPPPIAAQGNQASLADTIQGLAQEAVARNID